MKVIVEEKKTVVRVKNQREVRIKTVGRIGPRGIQGLQGVPGMSTRIKKTKPRIAFIGSSYTHQATVMGGSGTTISTSARGWPFWLNAFLNNAFNMDTFLDAADPLARGFRGANFGYSGQTSTEIRARIPDVVAKNPDVCIIQSGSNNVTAVSTVIEDIKASIDLLHAAGIMTIYLGISFRGALSWTTTQLSQASYINAEVSHYLASTGKGIFIDPNKYLCDFNSAEGRPLAGALNPDDIHYNSWSGFQIGRVLQETLGQLFVGREAEICSNADVYDATNNPYGNKWTNPFVSVNAAIGTINGSIGGSGITAGTGAAATSVGRNVTVERSSGTSTGVANVESRGPGLGNWQTLTVTPTGSATSLFYIRHGAADITHGLAAGTWVRFGCAVDLSTFGAAAFSGFEQVALSLDFRNSGGTLGKSSALLQFSAGGLPNVAWRGVIETPPFQVPAGSDRMRPRLEVITSDTATGTGTVKAGSFYTRPCADPTLVW